jgi:hypothetical protein
MMDLLIVLASIAVGLAISFIFSAKPGRIWHARRKQGLASGQPAADIDPAQQQFLTMLHLRMCILICNLWPGLDETTSAETATLESPSIKA